MSILKVGNSPNHCPDSLLGETIEQHPRAVVVYLTEAESIRGYALAV